jgi:hypothetical protein
MLVDLSELGALVRLPVPQTPDKRIKLQLEWQTEMLPIEARVVRSSPRRVELPSGTLARDEYHVGLEFGPLSEPTILALRQIIRGQ